MEQFAAKLARRTIYAVDWLVDFILLILVLLLALLGVYAMWDANQIYAPAMADQYEIYKPAADTEGFEELRAINPDVIGWITMYGTGVDYPLLQNDDNDRYVHTDVKGKYSLTGSLFLDWRNDPGFTDFNSIIYGHNMAKEAMFGGLYQYAQAEYFSEHTYGSLYFEGQTYGLEAFAFFLADAYDRDIYTPAISEPESQSELLEYIQELAIQYQDLNLTTDDHIVLFSTCTSDMTNGRHLLALKLTDQVQEDPYYEEPKAAPKIQLKTERIQGEYRQVPYWVWYAMLVLAVFLLLVLVVNIICWIVKLLRRIGGKERVFHENQSNL